MNIDKIEDMIETLDDFIFSDYLKTYSEWAKNSFKKYYDMETVTFKTEVFKNNIIRCKYFNNDGTPELTRVEVICLDEEEISDDIIALQQYVRIWYPNEKNISATDFLKKCLNELKRDKENVVLGMFDINDKW